jgi:hypothetical protein
LPAAIHRPELDRAGSTAITGFRSAAPSCMRDQSTGDADVVISSSAKTTSIQVWPSFRTMAW